MNAQPKPKRIRDPKYLAWIRTQPCLSRCQADQGQIQAHHVRAEGHGGMGTKPDDRRTVPLCYAAHRFYHIVGRDAFEKNRGLNLEFEIERLNTLYNSLKKWEKA